MLTAILAYVSLRFVDQFIVDQGYNRIQKFFFPSKNYKQRLIKIIYETIDEFGKMSPIVNRDNKFPFYYSEVLFVELNNYILFNDLQPNYDTVIELFKQNPNIINPERNDLVRFYEIFVLKIKSDDKLKKHFIDENYKTKIFELGSMLNSIEVKIDNISSQVQTLGAKMSFEPSQQWFRQQCESSIHDLGKRYTPELNLQLEISEIFTGLGRTKEFKTQVTNSFDQFLIKGKKLLKDQIEIKDSLESLENNFDDLYDLFDRIDFLGTIPIPVNELENLLNQANNTAQRIYDFYLAEEHKIQKEKNDYQYYHKHSSELRNIREFKHELSVLDKLIHSSIFKLANNPFLLLDGEAGIGKSHLIGDIVSGRLNKGFESIFLLGQHFVSEESPWTQILKIVQLNSKSVDFLNKLNQRAEESGKRIVIFIDAINEGKGIYFWNNSLKSFISEIRKYPWLGLVLTIRTSYKNLIFPEDERALLDIVEHHHFGFRNIEYEASKLFFDNYKIDLPSIPLLHPEFQNPLFLKIFCEGINKAGLTRIPDGLQGITSIINFFIKNVNIVLAKPNRLKYSTSLNLVQKAIHALIKYKCNNQQRFISYEEAYQIVDKSISGFIHNKGFIDELITEGVLSKNLFYRSNDEHVEGVYLAYERFEDHLTAQYLLDQFPELEKEFKEEGNLFRYIKDERAINIHKGLIEAFSIQIPEKKGYEFHTLIPNLKDKYAVVESFIESLLWRKVESINEESKKYVNEHVFSYRGTHDLFWETIIAVTGIPNHFFNANSLHNHLNKYSLAQRDAEWTQMLKYKYVDESSVKRLIDWARSDNDKSHIADESILLTGIALTWFHTSTNRKLRDCATKALICLLQNRLGVLLEILQKFEKVNDIYVYERLFAVAYGCVLRTDQTEKITDLSDYIFKTIFNNPNGVIPHILLRDYARGVIEYAHYLGLKLAFDISIARPPYRSTWPEEIPSLDNLKEKYNNDNYRELWSSIMAFGDFSRYIIGTNSGNTEWSGCRKGEVPVDREQVFQDFKSKLDENQLVLLNNLDPIITKDSEEVHFTNITFNFQTAIGRKTEEELGLAKVEFKETLTPEMLSEYEKEIEPFLDHNNNIINTGKHFDLRVAERLILTRVIDLGWKPELHLKFDNKIGTGRGRGTTPHERIGKKYQWIAYYEYMAMLSDNFIKLNRWGDKDENPYQGPWDPYIRDIDPTMLIEKTGNHDDDDQVEEFWWCNNKIFNWNCTNESWVNDSLELPKFEDLILVKDNNGEEWLVLEAYPSWTEPKKIGEEKWDQPHKQLWSQIRSYLVADDEFSCFKDWAMKQDFNGRWMPESGDRYEMFSREYFWSPAQEYFKTEYYGGIEWREVDDNESERYIAMVNVTAQGFLWEEEFDESKTETISFLKPSDLIFKGMNLKYGQREGEYIDNFNVVQCFAANVYHNSKSYLLVRKNSLLKFLNDNNLRIVWTVLGEKEIIGGRSFGNDYMGRLDISGAYYFDNNSLVGNINTKRIKG